MLSYVKNMRACAGWVSVIAFGLFVGCSKPSNSASDAGVKPSSPVGVEGESTSKQSSSKPNEPNTEKRNPLNEQITDADRATRERIEREEKAKQEASALDAVNLVELEARARKGDKDAQNDLGVICFEGRRVPRDLVRATKLWAAAAAQGHGPAAENLRLLQLKEDEQEVDDSIAFFGTKSKGTRFVFIIDKSGSMTGRRFSDAQLELIKTLRSLPPKAFFMIYFFNATSEGMPVANLLPATPHNIEWAVKWVSSRSPGGGTDPRQSLAYTFQIQPHTIWLLSDGKFKEPQMVIRQIDMANRFRSVRVNTLAFHDRAGEVVLQQIAKANDGTYRFVSN